MLTSLLLAAAIVSAPAPISIQFTSDSVYTNESIISLKDLVEQENGLYTITLEQDQLLGYCIYDKDETVYTDGLKFDEEFVTNYTITDVDLSVEHYIHIKTVYTNDVAGMLAAAKDGDWSRIMSNPLTLLQLFYYLIALVSLALGGFGLWKSKKKKVKDHDQIAQAVDSHANAAYEAIKVTSLDIINKIVVPAFDKLKLQNQAIIEAFILAQSGDKNSKIALIDLLKSTATDDVTLVSDTMKKTIEEAAQYKEIVKQEADKLVAEVAELKLEEPKQEEPEQDFGGLTI